METTEKSVKTTTTDEGKTIAIIAYITIICRVV